MAQSGRGSAYGMCIETAFRGVPLTGVANPRTIGIAATNPHRFMILDPSKGFPVTPTIDVAENEIDGDYEIHRTILQAKSYMGEFAWKVDPENSYYPFLGVFGIDTQTVAQAADTTHSPTVYRHDFKPNGRRGYQPSFVSEEVFGDGTKGRLTSGCIVQKIQITFGKTVTATMSQYGHRQIPNNYLNPAGVRTDYDFGSTAGLLPNQMGGDGVKTVLATAAPVYVDVAEVADGNGPLVFAGMGFGSQLTTSFITVDGVPINMDLLEGQTLDIERNIQQFQTGGSEYDVGALTANAWKISGKMDILFKDNVIPLAVLKKAKVALNFKLSGSLIGTSGLPYALEVYCPNLNFLQGGVELPATAMMTGGNFQAKKDSVAGYSCMVSLWNTVDNTVLAGQASTTPGGLGGWNPS
jgi:hypothetical protein